MVPAVMYTPLRTPLVSALLAVVLGACGDDGEASASATEGGSTTASTTDASTTGSDSDSEAGSDSDSGGAAMGCDGASLLPLPDDVAAPGPWPVGAKTVTVAERTTEIWYPAVPGSEAGLEAARYDLRLLLPEAEQGKIPDEANPFQGCDCYRDLPLDDAHGPYPVVLFIHGTAGFRSQSLTFMTHWASRGFVVVSSDHDGITLGDVLEGNLNADQAGDAGKVLDALQAPAGELAFLEGHIDAGRIGMAGHSAGGSAISGFGGRAQVLMPMAAGGATPGGALKSTLILGAIEDAIVPYSSQQGGYAGAAPMKRLVGLSGAGHLAFSDLCVLGADQGGILQIALDYGVEVPEFLIPLAQDGCGDGFLDPAIGFTITNAATAAALQETLHCDARGAAALTGLVAQHPEVGEYLEALE
jgi:hypothetical protein